MTRIAISGKLGTGKTTAVNFLSEQISIKSGRQAELVKFAGPLYVIASTIRGLIGSPQEDDKWLMQKIGSDILRARDPDVWVKACKLRLDQLPGEAILIDDCRFPNELEFLRREGFIIVRLERNAELAEATNLGSRDKNHISEIALDDTDKSKFDFTITNNGSLEDFHLQLTSVVNSRS